MDRPVRHTPTVFRASMGITLSERIGRLALHAQNTSLPSSSPPSVCQREILGITFEISILNDIVLVNLSSKRSHCDHVHLEDRFPIKITKVKQFIRFALSIFSAGIEKEPNSPVSPGRQDTEIDINL